MEKTFTVTWQYHLARLISWWGERCERSPGNYITASVGHRDEGDTTERNGSAELHRTDHEDSTQEGPAQKDREPQISKREARLIWWPGERRRRRRKRRRVKRFLKRPKNHNLKRCIPIFTIYNSQNIKQPKYPLTEEWIKMWCIRNGLLHSHKKEWNAICCNMDGPRNDHTKGS